MYIIFMVNNQYYGFVDKYLKHFSTSTEYIKPPAINSEYVIGASLIEKEIYSIIDTHKLLGFKSKKIEEYQNSIYMLLQSKEHRIILPADKVIGLTDNLTLENNPIKSCEFIPEIILTGDGITAFSLDIPELCLFLNKNGRESS